MTIIAIVGATATGKTAASLALVRAIRAGAAPRYRDAEIINADAMQRYRGMDIGTAKVEAEVRAEVRHHQLDVLDVREEASVAAYQRHARADIAAIRSRGHLPIVVGGSGLYVRALLDEIDFPGTDAAIRARLEAEAERDGPAALHARLAAVDAVSAERLHPANMRRVARALEVFELTGRPFSAMMPRRRYVAPTHQFGCALEADVLAARIAERTEAMWRAGLANETEQLMAAGWGRTAAKATGYAQTAAYLRGELSAEQAREAITLATRQLAKKQSTWFRADPRITWLEMSGAAGASDASGASGSAAASEGFDLAPMLEACS